jgi:hypothetical protein
MKFQKIVGLAGMALAVVGAFVAIPNLAAILVVLGLVVGFAIDAPDHVRVIVSAVALAALSATLTSIPAVGDMLANIVSNIGVVTAGAAIMIILRNVYARFKP